MDTLRPDPPSVDREAETEKRATTAWLAGAAGVVLVVGVLYFGRDVLIPLAIAILLSFLLSPVVSVLRRIHVPRVLAVMTTAAVAFALIGGFALLVGSQGAQLARDLPSYQTNITEKLRDMRQASPSGGVVDRLASMLQALRSEVEADGEPEAAETPEIPVVEMREPPPSAFDVIREVAAPLVGPVGKAGLVVVLVIFILLEREDLRNRLIRLLGPNLHVTTEALDEAGYRVSRYLLMQLVVNLTYGIPFGIGLYLIGIPNAALWAVLAVLLRFIPYLGPLLSATFPVLLAVAVDPGWTTLLLTLGLVLALELISNNFIEPWLYGASTSISAVAIILAAIFWTTLWGPIGLLLATPLTVCLAVMGRYFPHLRFLDVMLGSAPALALHERFYQRLLAGDVDEDVRIAEQYLEKHSLADLYDDVALPALRLAAADDVRGALSGKRRLTVTRSALEIVAELADHEEDEDEAAARTSDAPDTGASRPSGDRAAPGTSAGAGERALSVLCAAGRSGFDLAVVAMLAQLLERKRFETRVVTAEALAPEHLSACGVENFDAICLSFLEGASAPRAQQMRRRLARRAPGKPMVIGLWNAAADQGERLARLPTDATKVETLKAAVDTLVRATARARKPYESPRVPDDEAARLREIQALGVLNASSERLERFTRRLSEAFGVPISLLNIVDEESQHWKAQSGLPDELVKAGKSPRDTSICGHVVGSNELLIVEDALKDPRFAKNPFLLEHGIRFYAGAPLRTREGHAIGSLCVIDASPRSVTDEEQALLRSVADEAMAELEALAASSARPPAGAESRAG